MAAISVPVPLSILRKLGGVPGKQFADVAVPLSHLLSGLTVIILAIPVPNFVKNLTRMAIKLVPVSNLLLNLTGMAYSIATVSFPTRNLVRFINSHNPNGPVRNN
ncbi:hypothetical protein IWQ62_006884 [Dispira parvispora]|uniref:Uncharacterized protein n=1 Tax=Dispira parvispora TaxID=1520584 RepID=A0A9W8AHJ5_9FUNG|nr:hypothetical protein IWQ62_006884 [Dispira parvispora]